MILFFPRQGSNKMSTKGWPKPILCFLGNINNVNWCSSSAQWILLGFIPPFPESSFEADADHHNVEPKHLCLDYK
jgi:hypothetical protein